MIVTPNSSLETGISSNLLGSTTVSASNVISADSSVASSVSLDEDIEESPIKVKKKDDSHNQVNNLLRISVFSLKLKKKLRLIIFEPRGVLPKFKNILNL